jgi:hypothetical protein
MKLIKNYLRTTLTNENLEYLLLCSVEHDLLDALDLSKLAEEWVSTYHYDSHALSYRYPTNYDTQSLLNISLLLLCFLEFDEKSTSQN